MRLFASIAATAGLVFGLVACDSGPPFSGVSVVKVRHIGPKGLTQTKFKDPAYQELVNCLYSTVEISEGAAQEDLLQTTYLLEVSDSRGDRSFELYTMENLKGNKGKYYRNTCAYRIIQNAQ